MTGFVTIVFAEPRRLDESAYTVGQISPRNVVGERCGMWQGFIGQTIAKSNKTMLVTGTVFLVLALGGLACTSRWIVNLVAGPFALDEAALASMQPGSLQLRQYARVTGDYVMVSGLTERTTETRNSEVVRTYTSGDYRMLRMGEHLLIVKSPESMQGRTYQGELKPLEAGLGAEIGQDLDAATRARFLPLMVDATGSYSDGFAVAIVVVGVLFAIAVWILVVWKRRADDYAKHPLARAVAVFGPLEMMVPQIDGEVMGGAGRQGALYVTRSWMLHPAQNRVMRKDEIVWAYKKRVKHSVNGIPTGSTYSSMVKDARGGWLELPGTEKGVHEFLNGLVQTMPWVMVGYDAKLEGLYNKDRTGFAQVVQERRKQIEGAGRAAQASS
jgi:uncharacterized protein DUF6709